MAAWINTSLASFSPLAYQRTSSTTRFFCEYNGCTYPIYLHFPLTRQVSIALTGFDRSIVCLNLQVPIHTCNACMTHIIYHNICMYYLNFSTLFLQFTALFLQRLKPHLPLNWMRHVAFFSKLHAILIALWRRHFTLHCSIYCCAGKHNTPQGV